MRSTQRGTKLAERTDTFVKSGGGTSPGANSTRINCWVSTGVKARWNSRGSAAATGSTRVIVPEQIEIRR